MATWKIIDGGLPFLDEFPQMYNIDDAPSSFWKIKDGDLPYRMAFPKMYTVRIEGDKLYYRNGLTKKIYLGDTNIKAVYKGDTKIF